MHRQGTSFPQYSTAPTSWTGWARLATAASGCVAYRGYRTSQTVSSTPLVRVAPVRVYPPHCTLVRRPLFRVFPLPSCRATSPRVFAPSPCAAVQSLSFYSALCAVLMASVTRATGHIGCFSLFLRSFLRRIARSGPPLLSDALPPHSFDISRHLVRIATPRLRYF